MAEARTLDLAPQDLRIVLDILRSRVPDRPVFAFGSRVTGKARRRSDLDLAIGGGPMPLSLRAELRDDFDESDLPITVDVVELATASDAFRARIERDLLPLSLDAVQETGKELVSA
jgi:predicted nucleotidyltransferase